MDAPVVDLAAEISALPPDHPAAPRAHLALAAARLGEVDIAVLTEIGQHPAMCARDVVEALRRPDVDYRNAYKDLQPRLGVLLAYGLVRERAFVRESDAVNRYVLTTRGLRLLAAHAMLAVADYQELYAIVADDGGPEQPALDFAYMFGAHTSGITAVFLSVRDAARARPGRLEWRGEWACIKTTRLGQLRPDAEFVYREANWWSRWFLEYERGRPNDKEIDAKLEKYRDLQKQYPDNSVRRADNTTYDARRGFTVLWVCERAHPAERILARYEAMSKPGWHSRLRVLVTTLQDLADGGIGRSVWRSKPGGSTTTIALGPDSRSETS
ncbi:MAG: replication-relaxation family protein [Chloroflexota bacterium]|nr:replication-relaxation family protein [Chloroflexota bacterium]